MFVTNKRVKLPKEIVVGSKAVNDKCEEIKVSVVNSWKDEVFVKFLIIIFF